ncbi:MAG TPA: hypothetical protein VMA30_04785 [Xanthobacteraceae bacterium]|nr:hypothetical protein [Xanthobacteraceae bacterium]
MPPADCRSRQITNNPAAAMIREPGMIIAGGLSPNNQPRVLMAAPRWS